MSTPLRVLAFTGGIDVPSARFRVRQYIPALAASGVAVAERYPAWGSFPPAARWVRPGWAVGAVLQRLPAVMESRRADVVLLQREMLSTVFTLEGLTGRPRVLDVDDAIHLYRGGRTARRLAEAADLVICGNAVLAEVYAAAGARVEILPTAVDPGPPPGPLPEGPPMIGWIGTGGNLKYLYAIEDALVTVLARFPLAGLAVCCDVPPSFRRLAARHVPWAPGIEAEFLAGLTVGLMPLADGPWERGKCSFKMLQYMAAGRACVVSPVGMNGEILAGAEVGLAATSVEEWIEALSALLSAPDCAAALGRTGRTVVEGSYSVAALAPRLAALLRSVAG